MQRSQLFQNPIWLFALLLLQACATTKFNTASPDVLMQADQDFSNLSKAKGVKTAFLQYIDDSAVLLLPDHYPVTGRAAKEYYEKQEGAPELTWAPQSAVIAASGELGYTYGLWTLTAKDTTLQGTYVTIWKKGKDGAWKFVLDSGNSGVGKK